MIQVLLLTRGGLALEWLRATAAVRGCAAEGFKALALDWDGSCESDTAHVHTLVRELRARGPLLILTDLHGSTPTNLAAAEAGDPEVLVVAGANLAMVLRLACDDREGRTLDELAAWICDKGRAAITTVKAPPPAAPPAGDPAPE